MKWAMLKFWLIELHKMIHTAFSAVNITPNDICKFSSTNCCSTQAAKWWKCNSICLQNLKLYLMTLQIACNKKNWKYLGHCCRIWLYEIQVSPMGVVDFFVQLLKVHYLQSLPSLHFLFIGGHKLICEH